MSMDPAAVQKFQAVAGLIARREEVGGLTAVCRKCGMLPWPTESVEDWDGAAGLARLHAQRKGHAVAVTFWHGEVFPAAGGEGDGTE